MEGGLEIQGRIGVELEPFRRGKALWKPTRWFDGADRWQQSNTFHDYC